MLRRTLLLLPLLLPMAGAPALATPEAAPREAVRTGVDEVLAVVRDAGLDRAAKRARIDAIVRRHFDFETMSRSALARNWRTATPEQQARFRELFPALIINTYFSAIDSYQGETVDVGEAKLRGNRAFVDSDIVTPSQRIPVLYRLREREGRWQVYDVVIEGVSLVGNYRSSFGAVVARDGMDALLEDLDQKLAAARERALEPS